MRRFIGIIILMLAVASSAAAQQSAPIPPSPPPPPPPPPVLTAGKWWKNSFIVKELGLGEDQVQKLEQVYLKHQSRLAELRNGLVREEDRLKTLLDAEPIDERSLLDQREKVVVTRGELERENSDMMLGLRMALTAQQWKTLQASKVKRSEASASALKGAPPPPPPPPPPLKENELQLEPGEVAYIAGQTPGLQLPVPFEKPRPEYTPEAKEKGIQGVVILNVVIRKDGRVAGAKVMRSLERGLDLAALNTVREKWRFQPGMLDGKPVNVKAVVEVSFRLE